MVHLVNIKTAKNTVSPKITAEPRTDTTEKTRIQSARVILKKRAPPKRRP
jgi:hypothetical protein